MLRFENRIFIRHWPTKVNGVPATVPISFWAVNIFLNIYLGRV